MQRNGGAVCESRTIDSHGTPEGIEDNLVLLAVERRCHVGNISTVRLDRTHESTLVTRIKEFSELMELRTKFSTLVVGFLVRLVSASTVGTVLLTTVTGRQGYRLVRVKHQGVTTKYLGHAGIRQSRM